MLDRKYVQENPDLVIKKLALRGKDIDLQEFLRFSEERRVFLKQVEDLRSEKNTASKQIGLMKKEGEDASLQIKEMKKLSGKIKDLEKKQKEVDEYIRKWLLEIPNIPHESVPVGSSSADNVEIRMNGEKHEFKFSPKPHWDIGNELGILDFERAAKIAGSRFAVYLGAGARLERALINYMLDVHTKEKGYEEILPPFIANKESLTATGQLPKFEEDLFKIRGYPFYMIPTAEVPVVNYYRDEILEADSLPIRFAAYTPCFRSEAGSYGKDVRGLIRQHQFNKVELISFSTPENSYDELEKITADAEDVLQKLGLVYRVVELCTGDLGFSSAKTYDIELWMPHRKNFLEISSCSNCEAFQARRANIRFRKAPKTKPEFIHTLNGSGVAIGRTVSAILENYQQGDGSIIIPEVLRPYMSGLEKIKSP
ncbi:MAG: serine--tRNA ligase [Candidatus Aminicenantes bacterium]|nr:serine--tRNA ligase [Candidatus Aminicenantes bacterium]